MVSLAEVAQLVEQSPCKRQVAGSNPAFGSNGPVAKWFKAPDFLFGIRGFESCRGCQLHGG